MLDHAAPPPVLIAISVTAEVEIDLPVARERAEIGTVALASPSSQSASDRSNSRDRNSAVAACCRPSAKSGLRRSTSENVAIDCRAGRPCISSDASGQQRVDRRVAGSAPQHPQPPLGDIAHDRALVGEPLHQELGIAGPAVLRDPGDGLHALPIVIGGKRRERFATVGSVPGCAGARFAQHISSSRKAGKRGMVRTPGVHGRAHPRRGWCARGMPRRDSGADQERWPKRQRDRSPAVATESGQASSLAQNSGGGNSGNWGRRVRDFEPRSLGSRVDVNDWADRWIVVEHAGGNDDMRALVLEHGHVGAADLAERPDVARRGLVVLYGGLTR